MSFPDPGPRSGSNSSNKTVEKICCPIPDPEFKNAPDSGSATLTEGPSGVGTHEYVADPGCLS
jgi:hypothetical protein